VDNSCYMLHVVKVFILIDWGKQDEYAVIIELTSV
jgi:hypothetical protein